MLSAPNHKAAEVHWTSSKTGRRDLPHEALGGMCLISMLYEFIFVLSGPADLRLFLSFKT